MFDFVRTHTRLMLGLMVLLIFPSFVFFGMQGYSRFTDGANADGCQGRRPRHHAAEWDAAHQRNVERMRRQMPNVDAKLLDTPQMQRETLDGLVRERVLLAAASQACTWCPSDARLQRLFVTDPQFASLRNPDGSVNRDLLAAQGMSSRDVRAAAAPGIRHAAGAGRRCDQPSLRTPAVAAASLDALLQRREVQLQRFDSLAYRARSPRPTPTSRPTTRPTRPSSARPSRPRSNTWCSTSTR